MYENDFARRLSQLRCQKGVSARDMSLSLGQSASYINKIENGKAMPSMAGFFYICDYLEMTPSEFFDTENTAPSSSRAVSEELKTLTPEQLSAIGNLIQAFKR